MAAKKGGTRAKLAEYQKKRDFTKTAEPAGAASRARSRSSARPPKRRAPALQFVVQKHAASHLHYDLRLELDGVMKSWAVPKGPSYDPTVRRLAMEVEDHPMEYNSFEGTIPKGEYGGGTVMLWDRGTYEAPEGGGEAELRDGYARGDLEVVLDGERLKGGWVLVRMKPREGDSSSAKAQWLLIKHRDDRARPGYDVTNDITTSVATGRTMEQIAAGVTRRGTKAAASRGTRSSPPRRRPTRSRS